MPEPLNVPDGLPFPVGPVQAVKREVTAFERESLEKFGWKPGDPVPADFAKQLEKLAVAAATAPASAAEAVKLTGGAEEKADAWVRDDEAAFQEELRRLSTPRPPEAAASAHAELAASIAEAKRLGARAGLPDAMTGDVPPSVLNAMRALAASMDAEGEAPAPDGAPPEAADDDGGAAGTGAAGLCPNCSWPIGSGEAPSRPSLEDKRAYYDSCLLGSRFTRDVALFDGAMVVTFQELTRDEISAVAGAAESAAPAREDVGRYASALLDRMFAASLVKLRDATRGRTLPAPSEAAPDALKARMEWARKTAAPHESLWRVLVKAFHEFRRLLEQLEAGASSPNFYREIHGRP